MAPSLPASLRVSLSFSAIHAVLLLVLNVGLPARAQQGTAPTLDSPLAVTAPSGTSADLELDENTFTNPLLPLGPDPWVTFWKGYYYYTRSTGVNLRLWKTRDITDLVHAERRVVWTPPVDTEYSQQIWAPELHRLDGKWYLYFAADDGQNRNHHIFVLENASDDPEEGEWTFKGRVTDPSLRWAIDPTILELSGRRYMLWSGWPDTKNDVQNLYIAELSNPWTIRGKRHLLSQPELPWEKQVGDIPPYIEIPHRGVNEAPEIVQHSPLVQDPHASSTFLVYSASGCWTDHYALGVLSLKAGKDPTKHGSWIKTDHPVLASAPDDHTFGPGHSGFFLSPDGTESWIIYHANLSSGQGCGNHQSPRIQPFHFDPQTGAPEFGRPVSPGQPISKPSGTTVSTSALP